MVLPEAFARDFGEPGSDLAPYAETLDGPFASALRELSTGSGTAWLAGMFEVADDPARPLNTLVLADDGPPDGVPEDPPLRLLRLPGVQDDQRGRRSSPAASTSADSRSA